MANKNLVLIGLKHSGKTTVGSFLAKETGCSFFDSDKELEKVYYEQTGKNYSFSHIYQVIGEQAFRELEQSVCNKLVKRPAPCVLALGGSTFLNQPLASLLKKHAVIIYLEISKSALLLRWRSQPPGFIKDQPVAQALEEYYQARAVFYRKQADLVISVDKKLCKEVCKDLEIFFKVG